MSQNLGPRLARSTMHMFWLLDVSGSMQVNGKIDALNAAMREAADSVRDAADENPGVQVMVRVVTFANDAFWHVGEPVDIDQFRWTDVHVVERGTTELGRAISLATHAIHEVSQAGKGLPPALVLVSDGRPTDLKNPTFGSALRALADEPWGRKASRMAIGIGSDADMGALQRFIGHDEIAPLHASSAEELRHYLKWASTVVVDTGFRPGASWSETSAPAEEPVRPAPEPPVTPAAPPAPPPAAPTPPTPAPAPPEPPAAPPAPPPAAPEPPAAPPAPPPAAPEPPAAPPSPPPTAPPPPPPPPDDDSGPVW